MNYPAAIEWLYGTQLFGIKLGLDNMRRLLGELGLFDALAGRKIIHVAGTNGKGSVCAMADAILRAAGERVGLFTSPHLVTFRERIRVNGEMMPENAIAAGLTELRERLRDWEPHPTFFEITLALAVRHFCENDCRVIVLETGMGGRLDATNALPSDVAVITPIGFDHTQWLGDTLALIAGEKAGIIKEGKPVISAMQPAEAVEAITREAGAKEAPLQFLAADSLGERSPALSGTHQRANAALAIAAARVVHPGISETALQRGLAEVRWPARFQRIGEVIIDGAHNAPAAEALVHTWRETIGDTTRATIIFGGVAAKDTVTVMRWLAPLASRWIFVKVASQRGLDHEALESAWRSLGIDDVPAERAADAADALEKSRVHGDPVLVTGSLYLAGEALAALQDGPPFEVSEQ